MNIQQKVKQTLSKIKLTSPKGVPPEGGKKILVALSGGKDSTVTAYFLKKFGYNIEGLHIDLGMGDYSKKCLSAVEDLCKQLVIKLHVYDIKKEMGSSMCYLRSAIQSRKNLKNCAICGVIKKWILNKEARKLKRDTGDKLLELLERRLDNVLFRGGLTPSRSIARQLVSHKQVLVDGKKVNIPSYRVKVDQTVVLTAKGMGRPTVKDFLKEKKATISPWLERKAAVVRVKRLPVRDEIEQDINEKLIIEFYSR